MPQPALTVFLIIAAIAIVVVLIAVIVIALRAQRRASWLRRWRSAGTTRCSTPSS